MSGTFGGRGNGRGVLVKIHHKSHGGLGFLLGLHRLGAFFRQFLLLIPSGKVGSVDGSTGVPTGVAFVLKGRVASAGSRKHVGQLEGWN